MDLQLRRRLRAALLVMALPLAASIVGARDVAQYSEIEQLRLDNLSLKQQLGRAIAERHAAETRVGQCYAELGPLAARANDENFARAVDRVKAEIEKAHPGYVFDVATATLKKKPEEK